MSRQYFTDSVQSNAQGLDAIRDRAAILFGKLAAASSVSIDRENETVILQDEFARFRTEELAEIVKLLDRQSRERLVWVASVVESPAYIYELMTVLAQAEADERAAQALAKQQAELESRERAVAADEKLVAQAIEAQSEAIRAMRAANDEVAAMRVKLTVAEAELKAANNRLAQIAAVIG